MLFSHPQQTIKTLYFNILCSIFRASLLNLLSAFEAFPKHLTTDIVFNIYIYIDT